MFSANSMLILRGWVGRAAAVIVRLKAIAPYALIELILPGGSLMALLLWLYRRRKGGVSFANLQCVQCVVSNRRRDLQIHSRRYNAD